MKYAIEKIYTQLEKLSQELNDHPDTPTPHVIDIINTAARRLRAQREMMDQGIEK